MYALIAFANAVNANDFDAAVNTAVTVLRSRNELNDVMIASGFAPINEESADLVDVIAELADVTISDDLYSAITRAV